MKAIRLYVDGQRFVITNDDGFPEVRREDASPLTRDRRATVVVLHEGVDVPVDIRVEEVA